MQLDKITCDFPMKVWILLNSNASFNELKDSKTF